MDQVVHAVHIDVIGGCILMRCNNTGDAVLFRNSHNIFLSFRTFAFQLKPDWNIMSNSAMTQLAAQVPTSMEELSNLGILGENVVNDYGERLVRNISSFVQQNSLEKYLERRAAKRPKVVAAGGAAAAAAPSSSTAAAAAGAVAASSSGMASKGIGKENEDFDAGIDFAAIDLPTGNAGAAAAAMSGTKKTGKKSSSGSTKSSYF